VDVDGKLDVQCLSEAPRAHVAPMNHVNMERGQEAKEVVHDACWTVYYSMRHGAVRAPAERHARP
jgi:hypothetical protein